MADGAGFVTAVSAFASIDVASEAAIAVHGLRAPAMIAAAWAETNRLDR
jgi:hypothetical protein